MTKTLSISGIPGNITWKNQPQDSQIDADGKLAISAGPDTDWFIDPAGGYAKASAPVALFTPPAENFWLKARVTVDFASAFDAGVLFLHEQEDIWAKLCFEYSPDNQPMVVSVVTRGVSDDCNGVPITGNSVYLRIYRQGDIFAFHYSLDGKYWNFVRYFTLGKLQKLQVGFEAQSPTGKTCKVVFDQIEYKEEKISNLRNGE